MSNDRGVFTLSAYRRAQVEGQGVDLNDVWLPQEVSKYGYMGGGYYVDSTALDKITFDTDTVARTPSTDLPERIITAGTFTSSSAGYLVAGYTGNPADNTAVSTVRKLTYATEVFSTASPGYGPGPAGPSPNQGAYGLMGAASPTYGYIAGGRVGPSLVANNRTRRMSFATESWDTFGATMTTQFLNMGDVIGNQDAGYWCGSQSGGASRMHKLTYSTETASTAGNIAGFSGNQGRSNSAGVSNATQGYLVTGSASPGPDATSTIQKIVFATDTAAVIPSQFPVQTTNSHATGNISNGYIGGGSPHSGGTPGNFSSVWKFDISTETASTLSSSLSTAAYHKFAVSATDKASKINTEQERWTDGFKEEDLKAGYYQGGGNPSNHSATQKVSFVTDQTSIVPGGSLPQDGSSFAGVNSNSTKTIITGGEPGGESFMKFVYATETSSNLTGSMPSRRTINNDMGYGTESLGYVTGGMSEPSNPGFYHSNTQKIEYATDTTSDVPGANAHQPMREIGAFGNVDHTLGYIVGGITKSPTNAHSRIQKMTYSTETIANTPANMQNNYFNLGTTTGPDAGYIYSKQEYPGYTANGAIEKFEYATDSRTTVPQPSYYPSFGANGTGNSTNGYYGGGGPNRYTRILKLNFSTGVGQDMPSSQFSLPSGVYRSAASSAVSRKKSPKGAPVPTPTPKSPGPAFNGAIWMGGYNALTNQYTSSGGKIDFSTDVITNLPSTQLTKQSYDLAATSSLLAGYYAQGAPSNTSIVKVDYATSSPSTLTSNLSGGPGAGGNDPRRRGASFGLKTAGYFMQGDTGSSGNLSNLDKITYSSDTSARLPGSNTTTGAYATVGASNQTNGYQTGGTPGGGAMRKMPFATESWGNAPGGSFPEMWDAKSMSNATHGYFIGGSGNAIGTRVYKLTFATDSTSQLPTNFPQYSRYGWGTGNSTHGYASGGVNTGSITTRIYKLQYSNDTWSTTPNRIQGGAIQQNAAASARQNGNGNTVANVTPNVV